MVELINLNPKISSFSYLDPKKSEFSWMYDVLNQHFPDYDLTSKLYVSDNSNLVERKFYLLGFYYDLKPELNNMMDKIPNKIVEWDWRQKHILQMSFERKKFCNYWEINEKTTYSDSFNFDTDCISDYIMEPTNPGRMIVIGARHYYKDYKSDFLKQTEQDIIETLKEIKFVNELVTTHKMGDEIKKYEDLMKGAMNLRYKIKNSIIKLNEMRSDF